MNIFTKLFKKKPDLFIKFPLDPNNPELDKNLLSPEEIELIKDFSKNDIQELYFVLIYIESITNGFYNMLKKGEMFEDIDSENDDLIVRSCGEFLIFLFVKIFTNTIFSNRNTQMKDFVWGIIVRTFEKKISRVEKFDEICLQSYIFWKKIFDELKSVKDDSIEFVMKKVYKQLIDYPMIFDSEKPQIDIKDFDFINTMSKTMKMTEWFIGINKIINNNMNESLN
jgi:hypothetical protein